jgi:hypothetical protein
LRYCLGFSALGAIMSTKLKPINELKGWTMPDVANVGHISPWMAKTGFELIHAAVFSELAGTPPMEGLIAFSDALVAGIVKRWGFELEEVWQALGDLMRASYLVPDGNCENVAIAVIGGDFADNMMDRLDKENFGD